MAVGYDISASASSSSSASTGPTQFGNITIGTASTNASWIWPVIIGAIILLWMMKKKK